MTREMTIEEYLMTEVETPGTIGHASIGEILESVENEVLEYASGFGANVSPLFSDMLAQIPTIPNGRKNYAQGGPVYPMTIIPNQNIKVSLEDY